MGRLPTFLRLSSASAAPDLPLHLCHDPCLRRRLHSLAQADCPGCWSLQKLIQFYESKTRGGSRAKKARGGR